MKNPLPFLLTASLLLMSNLSFAANDLVFVGFGHGPLSGAPKFAELYVINDIADLSVYGLGSANNGGGTDGQEWTFPAGAVTAGTTLFVANDTAAFSLFMGFSADYEDGGDALNFNGDDSMELFENGVVIDVFGDINTDGTDTGWEYSLGWVKRMDGTGPDGTTFIENNWTYSGVDVFSGQITNATSPTPYPTTPYSTGGGNNTGSLILVGIIHASADVKSSEYYVTADIPDLSVYGVGCANNGGGTDGEEWTFPAVSASAGDRLYVTRDSAAFVAYFGFDANFYDPDGDAHNFNGDDAFELFLNGEVVDVYGDINVDGTDAPWEYSTTWTQRECATGPDGSTFVFSNWMVGPLNGLSGTATNMAATVPYPVETYQPTPCVVPPISNLILVGIIHASADVKSSEYYVIADIPDLSVYGVGCANNGGGTDGEEWTFPAVSASAGDRLYVTRDSAAFVAYFGFDANFYDPDGDAHNFNGDDAFELFLNGEVVDVYGDINVDGTDEPWEYSTTWTQRECATGPDGSTFIFSNWMVGPLNGLAGTVTNMDAADPYPVDAYLPTPCGGSGGGTDVVITEIMYNSPGTDLEFLEIFNNTSDAIDMTGYQISNAFDFTFPNYTLGAGEYVLLSDDNVTFENFWGVPAFQWSGSSLNNGGEAVTLLDASGMVVDSINFDDEAPWSTTADGRGPSLVLCDPDMDNNNGANWQRAITSSGNLVDGREVFGNPGEAAICVDDPIIGMQAAEILVGEGDGTVSLRFYLDNPSPLETTVLLDLVPGGTASSSDFTFTPTTITFPANTDTAQTVTIPIIDDAEEEPEERFTLQISNPTNGAIITNDTTAFFIIDNDAPLTNALKIIGLIHGPVAGVPKAVELYTTADIPNLSLFGLGCANNGGGSDGQEYTFPAVSLDEGTCFFVANDTAGFRLFFDFSAEFQDDGAANNFNGDDAFEVFENGKVIDVFGDVNVDGTNEPWEYSLGWAHRVPGTGPDGDTFVLDNWEFSGTDVFVDTLTNAESPIPYPVGDCTLVNTEQVEGAGQVLIFPNPTSGTLQVESEIRLDQIRVYNRLGQLLYSLKNPADQLRLDLSLYPADLYMIQFVSGENTWVRKVVVSR